MKEAVLFNYRVLEDGTIIGIKGKKFNDSFRQIRVYWGKSKRAISVSRARFIYYAFNQRNFNFNDKTVVVIHKDGDKNNYNINNLVAVERKTIYQGENSSSVKLTDKQVEEIKDIYGKTHLSYRKLGEQYGVSHTQIMGIIKGTLRNKENYVMQ